MSAVKARQRWQWLHASPSLQPLVFSTSERESFRTGSEGQTFSAFRQVAYLQAGPQPRKNVTYTSYTSYTSYYCSYNHLSRNLSDLSGTLPFLLPVLSSGLKGWPREPGFIRDDLQVTVNSVRTPRNSRSINRCTVRSRAWASQGTLTLEVGLLTATDVSIDVTAIATCCALLRSAVRSAVRSAT